MIPKHPRVRLSFGSCCKTTCLENKFIKTGRESKVPQLANLSKCHHPLAHKRARSVSRMTPGAASLHTAPIPHHTTSLSSLAWSASRLHPTCSAHGPDPNNFHVDFSSLPSTVMHPLPYPLHQHPRPGSPSFTSHTLTQEGTLSHTSGRRKTTFRIFSC